MTFPKGDVFCGSCKNFNKEKKTCECKANILISKTPFTEIYRLIDMNFCEKSNKNNRCPHFLYGKFKGSEINY